MKYYLDEDISAKVAEIIRTNCMDALSALDTDMLGASDEKQLSFAASEGRALVIKNKNDFKRLRSELIGCYQWLN